MDTDPASPVPIPSGTRRRIVICAENLPFRTGLASILGGTSDFVVTGSYDSVKMAATTGRKSHTDVLMADAGPGESEARHVADQLTKYFPEARDRAILLIGTLGTPTIIRLIRSGVRTMVRRDGPVESIYHAVQAAHHRDTLFADGVLDTVLDHLPYRLPMEASDLPATAGLTKSERILSQWWPTAYPT